MYADAVWDRVGMDADDLSFNVGDVIEILDMSDDTWWQGSVQEKCGWFPSSFVRVSLFQWSPVFTCGEGRGGRGGVRTLHFKFDLWH